MHPFQFDARASMRCPEPGEGSQVTRRVPEGQHKGNPATPASKSSLSGGPAEIPLFKHAAWGIN